MDALKNIHLPAPLDHRFHELIHEVFSRQTQIELGIIVGLALVAWAMHGRQKRFFRSLAEKQQDYRLLARAWTILGTVSFPLTWLALQAIANLTANRAGWTGGIMNVTLSLITAWVVIRIASGFIRNAVISRSIALVTWTVAALNIIGWLHPTTKLLNSIGFSVGTAHVTLLTLFKGVASLVVLLWSANLVAEFSESRIRASSELTPSIQVLLTKLLKIILITVALLVAMSTLGIDLTAFAVVGGAIGVGLGFGLQKIVSNLVSGVILLMDNSIKPGDVIAIGEQYGRVDSLGARYVSVTTRDGIEHLIPNEDLIINRVENWSHSNKLLRLTLDVGVHYKSDVHKAMQLCLEAARDAPRVLNEPEPVILMSGFGDNSVNLRLRYWINDPMMGKDNVSSDILVRLWDMFAEHNIEIPYPQRDIHLRTPTWEELDRRLRD